jgi:outer membrane protein assembly factor BamB
MKIRYAFPPFVGALALAVAACSGDARESQEPKASPKIVPTVQSPPPPAPVAEVLVRDGDTSKPVRDAVVAAGDFSVRTDDAGIAALGAPRERATLRVSARGYGSRTVHVSFRRRLVREVVLFRPAVQWPMYGVNTARTQVHPAIKLRPPFRVVWTRDLRALLEFPAVVWNGVAYVNNIKGWLRALSMKNGGMIWRQRVGRKMASSPGIDPKRGILVTTSMRPGYVNVLSMKTGRLRWRYYTGLAEPSPLIRKGIAYFGATNGNVYALDLDRRRPRWVFHGGIKITSSPALVGNRLYFGDYAGRVYALDARNGRVIWTGSAGSRVYGTVAVAGGRVFAPSVFSGLSALSARTGRLLWRIPSGAYLYSSPAAYRGRVYFGTYAGLVYCASASSGRILWRASSGGRVSGAVEVVGGLVYAASLENRTTAWNWRTGRQVWSFPHGRYVPVSGNASRLLIHGAKQIWAVVPKRKKPGIAAPRSRRSVAEKRGRLAD